MKPIALILLFFVHGQAMAHASTCPDPSVDILLRLSNAEKRQATRLPTDKVIDLIVHLFPSTECLYSSVVNDFIHEDLRTHTLNAAAQFQDQKRFYDLPRISEALGIDVLSFMPALIALHDIGKPISKEIYQDTAHQTAENRVLLLSLLSHLGFAPSELKLADILVSHDDLGDYLQGKMKIDAVEKSLKTRAILSGFGGALKEYFQLQVLYYTSDATAHKWVRENFFIANDQGKLLPKNNQALVDLGKRF